MNSSTFDSNPGPGGNRVRVVTIAVLLTLVAIYLVSIELATRIAFDRASNIQRRIHREYQQAVELGQDHAVGQAGLLVLGNSLLESDVQFPDVCYALAKRWETRRLVIENTSFLDWYYGTRRLFAEGARPRMIALMLAPRHLIDSATRGDYAANYMMRSLDVLRMSSELELSRTETSNMLFARMSKFYAVRGEIRKWLLGSLMPDLPQLTILLAKAPPAPTDNNVMYATAVARLGDFKRLVTRFGARFIFLVAPTLLTDGSEREYTTILRAADRVGVPVVAIPPGTMGQSDFSDGFHLNEIGARKYTELMLPILKEQLASQQDKGFVALSQRNGTSVQPNRKADVSFAARTQP